MNIMKEEWKQIEGYKRYHVSNLGRVRSLNLFIYTFYPYNKEYYGFKKGKLLKPALCKGGYQHISLSKKGISQTFNLHRLVGLNFLKSSYFEGAEINHKNGVKIDNNVKNLEWVTHKGNQKQASKMYLYCTRAIKNIFNSWRSITAASLDTGINASHISECAQGKRKTAGGIKWEYVK